MWHQKVAERIAFIKEKTVNDKETKLTSDP